MYSLIVAAMLTAGGEAPNCCWGWGYPGWYGNWGNWGVYAYGWGWGGYGCCGWGGPYWGGYPGWYGGWSYPGWYYPGYYYPGYYSPWYAAAPAVAPPEGPPPRTSADTARATVKVHLPAEARLYADGELINLTSATRTFVTPELKEGREYWYNLEVVFSRDGKVVVEKRKVQLRRGQLTEVRFKERPGEDTSSIQSSDESPAHITVRVPAEAKLYVDGKFCPIKSEVRSFDSPPLPGGKKFFYVLKIETVRDGETRTEIRKVSLEAGKNVEVDFNKAVVAQSE